MHYRNALPLQLGLEPAPALFSPAEAVEAFRAGHLDGALLPLAAGPELQASLGDDLAWVRGVGIATQNEAYSVFLAHRRNPREPLQAQTCYLDPASRTSRALLEILRPKLQIPLPSQTTSDLEEADHVLLIGDRAITFRQTHLDPEWFYEDLGKTWRDHTGRPFVFAVWMLRRSAADGEAHAVAEWLRQIPQHNQQDQARYLATLADPQEQQFLEGYWRRTLHYQLGPEEEAGAELFLDFLTHGNAASRPSWPWI